MKRDYRYTILIGFAIAVIIAVIVGFSLFAQNLLKRDSSYLVMLIEEMKDDIKNDRWDNANDCLKKVNNKWAKVNPIWAALIDHQEIDNIDSSFSRVKMLVECKDKPMALSEAEVLKDYIDHIPDKEKPTLENIF